MTTKELQGIESELQKRAYRKWLIYLSSKESWGWFKTFGEKGEEYQVEFRVWDYTRYNTYGEPYGFDVWTSPKNAHNNCMVCGWEPIADIATFEKMAEEFNQLVRKYVKDNQK